MSLYKGLLLLPNLLDESLNHKDFLPFPLETIIPKLDGLIAESAKGGRYFLRRFTFEEPKTFRDVPTFLLNEHSTDKEILDLLEPLKRGETWGVVSDAGLPILADPGSKLVMECHKLNIPVHTFPGPSSIVYALMLSGLPAQNFTFHGYLPRDLNELEKKLSQLEKLNQTHVFIEVPYRTEKLLSFLIEKLRDDTLLSLSWNLTLPTQGVKTQTVKEWKKKPLSSLNKTPAVFLFLNCKNK